LHDWKVQQREWNNRQCYVFQYFNEKGELEFVSYREVKQKSGLKGGCEPNTKSILWGMWHIDVTKPVVITEGQPDAMAIWESGYKNVVSVPGGSNNYEWINNCWDWLETIDEFIIFGDNDDAGMKMVEELSSRLGKHRVKVAIHEYKDANEVLYRQGKEEIIRVIEETISQLPKGLLDMSKIEYVSYRNRKHDGISTGIRQLDETIDDLHLGELSILFGRNGDGKSTLVSQILANNIDKKNPVFLYSGELSSNRLLNWLFRQVIGSDKNYLEYTETKYGKIKADVNKRALEALRKWSNCLFFSYDKSAANVRKDTDSLFEVMAIAAKRYGCKFFIVDNLMSAMEEVAESLNSDQSNFTQQCKDFAEAYNVHVMLVAHPNKLKKRGVALEKEDISGSNNIPNKADIILSVERNYSPEPRTYDVKLKLLKDREEGRYIAIKFVYNQETKRLVELEECNGIINPVPMGYDWKKYLDTTEWWEEECSQEELDIPF
jgi:twinkle protein